MNMEELFLSGDGKYKLKNDLKSFHTRTLRLRCTPDTRILCLDVDVVVSPKSAWSQWLLKLLEHIREDDLISYSDQYTIDDVRKGLCHFKVFYHVPDKDGTYSNPRDLTLKQLGYDEFLHNKPEVKVTKQGVEKTQNKIELFYGKNTTVAMRGKRHDNYNYVTHGKLQTLPFVLQDVLPYKVTYKKAPKVKELEDKVDFSPVVSDITNNGVLGTKITNTALTPLNDTIELDDEGNEFVSITEFTELIEQLNAKYPGYNLVVNELKTQADTLLSFKCLFPGDHTNMSGSNANAYAFKKDGVYVCKCHGMVCSESYKTLNYRIKTVRDYPDLVGYSDLINKDYKVNLFKAYTGLTN